MESLAWSCTSLDIFKVRVPTWMDWRWVFHPGKVHIFDVAGIGAICERFRLNKWIKPSHIGATLMRQINSSWKKLFQLISCIKLSLKTYFFGIRLFGFDTKHIILQLWNVDLLRNLNLFITLAYVEYFLKYTSWYT